MYTVTIQQHIRCHMAYSWNQTGYIALEIRYIWFRWMQIESAALLWIV